LSGVASCWSSEYSVVVLPLPVGPVARMMPWGRATMSVTRGRSTGEKPRLARLCTAELRSRMRITTFSPLIVGRVEMRRSTIRIGVLTVMRPSCGWRRSEMSSSDMILSRDTSDWCCWWGIWILSISTPSMR
jgi:hypothetical protein